MASMLLFEGKIGDPGHSLRLMVVRDLDNAACPIHLTIDGDEWLVSYDDAARLAAAAQRIAYRLDRAAEQGAAPKAEPFFRRKVDYGGDTVAFEIGVTVSPTIDAYLEWGGKRVDAGDRLLNVLARIGEAVADIRSTPRQLQVDRVRGW